MNDTMALDEMQALWSTFAWRMKTEVLNYSTPSRTDLRVLRDDLFTEVLLDCMLDNG
jgi:hypothetical protein